MTDLQAIHRLFLKIQLKNFVVDASDANYNQCLSAISQLTLTQLADFCCNDRTVCNLLALPNFDTFWRNQREAIKVKSLPGFRFQKAARLSDMHITLGYVNFFLSIKDPQHRDNYLQRALDFHSFHAVNRHAHQCFMQLSSSEVSYTSVIARLPFFEQEAKILGTPGYLIVANLYFKAAMYAVKQQDEAVASIAFQMVLTQLCMASLAQSRSHEDIHNAYFSKGLENSNPFALKSIDDMLSLCIQKAGRYLSAIDIKRAIHLEALKEVPLQEDPSESLPSVSPIQQAILEDSPELLSCSFDTENASDDLLLFAVQHGSIQCVRTLLARGLNTKILDEDGNSLLHIAALLQHRGIFRLIHNADPALLETVNGFKLTPEGILRELNRLSFITNTAQKTLTASILNGGVREDLEQCLELGASPDVLLPSNISPLAYMLQTFNVSGIKRLLKAGASLSFDDRNGETAVFSVLKKDGSVQEIKQRQVYCRHLMNLGADINHQNHQGESVLMQAIQRGDYQSVVFLLGQPELNVGLCDAQGYDAKHYAKTAPNSQITRYFKAMGTGTALSRGAQDGSAVEPSAFTGFGFFGSAPKTADIPEKKSQYLSLK